MRRRSSLKGENAALALKFWWDSAVSQSDHWTEQNENSLVDGSVTNVVKASGGYIGEHKHNIEVSSSSPTQKPLYQIWILHLTTPMEALGAFLRQQSVNDRLPCLSGR